jgi:hypothetical protein
MPAKYPDFRQEDNSQIELNSIFRQLSRILLPKHSNFHVSMFPNGAVTDFAPTRSGYGIEINPLPISDIFHIFFIMSNLHALRMA